MGDIEPRSVLVTGGVLSLLPNGRSMTNERSVRTIWSEGTENGIVLHMRVGTGADVMLTLPNAEVAAQAEAQLRSTLAMATMRFQRVAKDTPSSGKSWEGFLPEGDQGPRHREGRDPREGDLRWSPWPPPAVR